jgi:zinc protease
MRLALFLALLWPGIALAQISDNVQTSTLKNGMKILVQEDHTIPTVALYFFYRVGSRDEKPGITGISHFFEHMMFNGSQLFGPGEFDRQMEVHGGNNNAYTTKDVTVYTDWFPPDALELMMRMESDRMAHLAFQPKIVESERGVVYSERRLRVDNDNLGALSEQVNAAAIIAHPYHWPVVGWASDIESWTMQDLEMYYKQGYAPNNCILVAAGVLAPLVSFNWRTSISKQFHRTPLSPSHGRSSPNRKANELFAFIKRPSYLFLCWRFTCRRRRARNIRQSRCLRRFSLPARVHDSIPG